MKINFNSIGGRKFIAFIVSCILLWFGKINAEIWVICFGVFVGANVGQKIGLNLKEEKNGSNTS